MQQVLGHEQPGLVADHFEEKGYRLVEGVALGQEQQAVEGFQGAIELQLSSLLAVEVAAERHVANGHDVVEPGVGDGLHRAGEAMARTRSAKATRGSAYLPGKA